MGVGGIGGGAAAPGGGKRGAAACEERVARLRLASGRVTLPPAGRRGCMVCRLFRLRNSTPTPPPASSPALWSSRRRWEPGGHLNPAEAAGPDGEVSLLSGVSPSKHAASPPWVVLQHKCGGNGGSVAPADPLSVPMGRPRQRGLRGARPVLRSPTEPAVPWAFAALACNGPRSQRRKSHSLQAKDRARANKLARCCQDRWVG